MFLDVCTFQTYTDVNVRIACVHPTLPVNCALTFLTRVFSRLSQGRSVHIHDSEIIKRGNQTSTADRLKCILTSALLQHTQSFYTDLPLF